MKQIDLILLPRWIVPVVPAGAVFENCAVAIHEGRIESILPKEEALQNYEATETIELNDQALLPGLINAHGHAAMSLLRGYADDLPLDTWLNEHIWPAEAEWVSEEFVRDGTRIAIAEMLKTGTTCFNDMYFFPDVTAEVSVQAGMRSRVSFPVIEFPSAWAQSPDEYIHKGLALHDQYRNHSLIGVAFGPHAPYTVSDETFTRVATLSEELDTAIHVHLHETEKEVQDSIEQTGMRPIERLNQIGILGPRTEAVHMTQVSDTDFETIQETNTSVIHCPKSNLKLASGFCPVQQLIESDVTLGLGTDSSASNNCLNMLEEMRFASLIGKAASGSAIALSAQQSLELATLGSATAMGMQSDIGSLEVGKLADIISININVLSALPLYNLISQIVYSIPTQVSNSWINGRQVLKNGELLTLSESELSSRASDWKTRISGT